MRRSKNLIGTKSALGFRFEMVVSQSYANEAKSYKTILLYIRVPWHCHFTRYSSHGNALPGRGSHFFNFTFYHVALGTVSWSMCWFGLSSNLLLVLSAESMMTKTHRDMKGASTSFLCSVTTWKTMFAPPAELQLTNHSPVKHSHVHWVSLQPQVLFFGWCKYFAYWHRTIHR